MQSQMQLGPPSSLIMGNYVWVHCLFITYIAVWRDQAMSCLVLLSLSVSCVVVNTLCIHFSFVLFACLLFKLESGHMIIKCHFTEWYLKCLHSLLLILLPFIFVSFCFLPYCYTVIFGIYMTLFFCFVFSICDWFS